MNMLTDKELRAEKCEAFRGGVVLAMLVTAAAAAAYFWLYPTAPAAIDAPSIVRQTENQTVARIPTLHAGARVDCTAPFDQGKNLWSLTC